MSAVRVGWEDIKSGYKMYTKSPFYALFDSNGRGKPERLIYAYKGGDLEGEGWELLEENLKVAEHTTPTSEYVIQFYDQLGKNDRLDSTTPYAGSFKLKLAKFEKGMERVNGAAAGASGSEMLHDLFASKLENIELKWEHKFQEQERIHQEELQDLEEELEKKGVNSNTDMGQITGLVEQVKPLIELILDAFKSKPRPQQYAHPGNIAGVPGAAAYNETEEETMAETETAAAPPERLNKAVYQLLEWYTAENDNDRTRGVTKLAIDLEKLAKMCRDNPSKMKMLINFL